MREPMGLTEEYLQEITDAAGDLLTRELATNRYPHTARLVAVLLKACLIVLGVVDESNDPGGDVRAQEDMEAAKQVALALERVRPITSSLRFTRTLIMAALLETSLVVHDVKIEQEERKWKHENPGSK